MLPLELLDRVSTPDGLELSLSQRGEMFFIRLDGLELMASRGHGSEQVHAVMACDHVRQRSGRDDPRALVGGLGMGYTLRATLDHLPPGAEVVVAEVFERVVEWNRGPLSHLAGHPLKDRRVRVEARDVAEVIATANDAYDAILLDVDNGPEAFTLASNESLYSRSGLDRIRAALRPRGVLAVWSADSAPVFERRLRKAGFAVRRKSDQGHRGRGHRHTLYMAYPDRPGSHDRRGKGARRKRSRGVNRRGGSRHT